MSNDLAAEMETKCADAKLRYVYDVTGGLFWKQSRADEWIELREVQLRRDLKKDLSLNDKAIATNGEKLSKLDDFLRDVEQNQRVRRAANLAGYRCGVHDIEGDRVLVPRKMRLIEAKQGAWLCLAAMLEGMFVGDDATDGENLEHFDQRDWWLSWEKHWLESLYAGEITNGLWLTLAGEPESGKTRMAWIMKELAGGREGKPYDFMIGRDNFNSELFEASLLLIDDENSETDIESRKSLAAHIKRIVANDALKLRGMHANGWNMPTTRRGVALVNNSGESLLVLPPLTGDLQDKMLMLKAYRRDKIGNAEPAEHYLEKRPALAAWLRAHYGEPTREICARCWPLPMPTYSTPEQRAFREQILGELPAFVFFLLSEYVPPSQVAGGRFGGPKHWQHPELVRELAEFAPYVRLWQLIEKSGVVWQKCVDAGGSDRPASFEPVTEWSGTVEALFDLLTSESSKLSRHEKEKELGKPSWVGIRLADGMRVWGRDVIDKRHTRNGTFVTMRRSAERCV